MSNITQIIQELKTSTYQYTGEKLNEIEKDKPINKWTLRFQNDAFIYEQVYFNGDSMEEHEHLAVIKMVFTEQELVELFSQQENRYFYNAKLN